MREIGFYWIKLDEPGPTEWTVGHFDGDDVYPWQVIGSDELLHECQVKEIGPMIQNPYAA